MKVGTDIEESLYDPKEVALNAKKFDSLFKKHKFSSTDNLDEIVDLSIDEDVVDEKKQEEKIIPKEEENKSYTNTVNSNEFREFLRKKGLSLFPKPKEANTDCVDSVKADKISVSPNDKKKTVFRRLSSIFSKNKTSPKQNETKARLSFGEKGEISRSSMDKRHVIVRSKYQNGDNGPILANNEFLTSQNFMVGKHLDPRTRDKSYDSDEKRSSISSVLTAAADEESVIETPSVRRKNPSLYRSIDFNRSKLFNDRGKPQADSKMQPIYLNRVQAPIKDSRSSLRKSNDYQFQPVKTIPHQTNYVPASSTPIKANNQILLPKPRESNGTATAFVDMRSTGIDPFTFAKIHEIKRKTDRVFQHDNHNEKSQFNNSNFVRNSNVRSSDSYQNSGMKRLENLHKPADSPQPQRSQSVLDNMTCYQNSLYGEVTYRQPNGSNVNVMMRRPSSSTLDRKQIMDKIYEYYRKSVNNTPVSFQENSNIYQKSQSTINPHNRSLNDTPTYWQPYVRGSMDRGNRPPKIMEHFSHIPVRKSKLSESDSEFPSESISSMDNYPRYSNTSYPTSSSKASANEAAARIYDVVNQSPRDALYGYINRQRNHASLHSPSPRPTSQRRVIPIASRATPILPQSPSLLSNDTDIIYNNKIYRPIATIQPNRMPQPQANTLQSKDFRSSISNRPENVEFRRPLVINRRKFHSLKPLFATSRAFPLLRNACSPDINEENGWRERKIVCCARNHLLRIS